MAILITGGAGYIGSHCVKIMQERGYDVVVLDNLSTGHKAAVGDATLYIGNIDDGDLLAEIFGAHKIDAVIHFAASSLVVESQAAPYKYYQNNVAATNGLLYHMTSHGVDKIVFSSTAAVYGIPEKCPITENMPTNPINTYGETKLAMERMMATYDRAHGLKYAALRYFNVAGAHEDGNIGEDHNPETHLVPNVLAVATGKVPHMTIFGDDYNTPDGTNIRDYIHISDLIDAHIKALEYLLAGNGSDYFNLGSGGGYSNMEILNAARSVTGLELAAVIGQRRGGDPDTLIASSEKAERVLGWTRRYTGIEDIIAAAWRWHERHPNGYGKDN